MNRKGWEQLKNKSNLHSSEPRYVTKRREIEEATHPQTWTVSYGKRSMTQKVRLEIQRIEPSTKEIHSQEENVVLSL